MTPRENLEAFWSGQQPDRVPYSVYDWLWMEERDDPAWQALYDRGLLVTFHNNSAYDKSPAGVEYTSDSVVEDNVEYRRDWIKTPVGNLCRTTREGWTQRYWLNSADDYRIMTWLAHHSEVRPCYEAFESQVRRLPSYGVALVNMGRSPLQTILVDYAGLENFAMHLFDFEQQVRELYDALLARYRQRARIVAEGPGRYVCMLENFTSETMGAQRFGELLLSVYRECYPMMQQGGKIIGNHYDGKIAACAPMIADSPIDLIESFTEPPEGDLTLADARRAMPRVLLWANLNVSDYALPPRQLRERVQRMVADGSAANARFAMECSEHLPTNWRISMPIVLDALAEVGRG